MLTVIDKDFYCSAGLYSFDPHLNETAIVSCITGNMYEKRCKDCLNRHRKHPTVEQFKQEYGFEYPDDGAVWYRYRFLDDGDNGGTNWYDWHLKTFKEAKMPLVTWQKHEIQIICACTPFGKPDNTWRPE